MNSEVKQTHLSYFGFIFSISFDVPGGTSNLRTSDKLQKYLKTVKRCNNNNLTQCWSSNNVTIADGSRYNVANAKTGKDLHTVSTTNTVGFVLADGGRCNLLDRFMRVIF